MKYAKLLSILSKMSISDLEKDVTVEFDGELFAIVGVKAADADLEDRVDDGTLILKALTDDGQLTSHVTTTPKV